MSDARESILQSIAKGHSAQASVPDYVLPPWTADAESHFKTKAKASMASIHEIASPQDAPEAILSILASADISPRLHLPGSARRVSCAAPRRPAVMTAPFRRPITALPKPERWCFFPDRTAPRRGISVPDANSCFCRAFAFCRGLKTSLRFCRPNGACPRHSTSSPVRHAPPISSRLSNWAHMGRELSISSLPVERF